jgi:hypothetical protein
MMWHQFLGVDGEKQGQQKEIQDREREEQAAAKRLLDN